MDIKRFFVYLIMALLASNIVFFIYFSNFNLVVFYNPRFFNDEFTKYGVFERFPNYNITKINENVLSYLDNKKDIGLINEEFFNQKEKQHLLDVKDIFNRVSFFNRFLIGFSVFLLILLHILVYLEQSEKEFLNYFNKKMIKQLSIKIIYTFLIGSILTLFSLLIFWLSIKFNFDFAFDLMHKSLFAQGSWLFSPSENIINLYTIGFFYDIPLKISTYAFYSSLTIIFICISILKLDSIRAIK